MSAKPLLHRDVELGREISLSDRAIIALCPRSCEDFALAGFHDRCEGGPLVYGVCKEKPQRLRSYAEVQQLPFELLADPTGEVSALYGYYDWERRSTMRGFVVLDRRSVVRLALQGPAPPEEVVSLAHYTIAGY
jgi:peroxiredoxin